MAVTNPIMGGKSLAFAIPKLSGNANKNTKKPEVKSEEKFCFKPWNPSNGGVFFVFMKKMTE
jgi:hypothetical protein